MNSAISHKNNGLVALTAIVITTITIALITPSVSAESYFQRKAREAKEKIEARMRSDKPAPAAEKPIVETPVVETPKIEAPKEETVRVEAAKVETQTAETPTNSSSANEGLQQVAQTNAAKLAEDSCVKAGEEDKAAKIALLFTTEYTGKSLASNDISPYLAGLCVPKDFDSQFLLNQFLVTKGSTFSFYAERSLEELAEYLDESGVELSVKIDALNKDSKLQENLAKQNDMDKAEYLLNQKHHYSENIEEFLPAIAKLKDEQKKEALEIAAKARAHSTRSTFFLSRSLYVSEKMAGAMMENAKIEYKENESTLKKLRDDKDGKYSLSVLEQGADWLNNLRKKEKSSLQLFTKFISDNAEVLSDTLSSGAGIVSTFDTDASEIPTLSDKDLEEDVQRLNDEWDFPAEFADEDAYGETNQYPTS